jgi:hypothetical protein
MNFEKVFIATPTAGGIVAAAFANTLVGITLALGNRNIKYSYCTIDSSDIVTARNYLANSFIRDETSSHILFIDSDMAVPQETLATMISSEKDFIGTVYPQRNIDLQKYGSFLLKGYSHEAALASALHYNVRHFRKDITVENGLCRVRGMGFGFVLIARTVFEKLINQNVVLKLRSSILKKVNLDGETYDFFAELPLESGERLSEDYSFCERVNRAQAAEIWAVIGKPVGHVGKYTYGVPYIEKLRADEKAGLAVAKTAQH